MAGCIASMVNTRIWDVASASWPMEMWSAGIIPVIWAWISTQICREHRSGCCLLYTSKNSTDYPIYIEGYTTSDKKITFNIYGKETRDSNRSISFESVLVNEVKPNTILRDDAGQGLGYKNVSAGKTGYVAELYKIVKVNGVQTDRIKICLLYTSSLCCRKERERNPERLSGTSGGRYHRYVQTFGQ